MLIGRVVYSLVGLLLVIPESKALLLPTVRPLLSAASTLATDWVLSSETPLVLDEDVVIADSPGRGRGVFALRPIPQGTLAAPYVGELRTDEEIESASEPNLYLFTLGNGWCIDGANPERSNWVRYLNHSRRRVNCGSETILSPVGGIPTGIAIRTIRDVAAGEELFIDYGDAYWEKVPNPIDRLKIHYG